MTTARSEGRREMRLTAAAAAMAAAVVAAAAIAGCYESRAIVDGGSGGPGPDWSACTGDPATASVLEMVESVGDPEGGFIRVALADGNTYLFDAGEPSSAGLAEIVGSRMGRGEPVYFEYERATKVIVDLGLPMELRVLTIEEVAEGSAMTFEVSAAIHLMRSTISCYDLFVGVLEDALEDGTLVWVTHNALYEVIDVRPAA